jgi:hypothetical protein
MTPDTRAQAFAEWWNGRDASGRGRLAASDGSFYGIAQDAWLAAWSARDEEIAAKDAEIERLEDRLREIGGLLTVAQTALLSTEGEQK